MVYLLYAAEREFDELIREEQVLEIVVAEMIVLVNNENILLLVFLRKT